MPDHACRLAVPPTPCHAVEVPKQTKPPAFIPKRLRQITGNASTAFHQTLHMQLYSLPFFHFRYAFLCCSRNIKVAIVWGPNLTKLGTQPLKHQVKPSVLKISATKPTTLLFSFMLITRVLITSTGEQIVVATKPLSRLAEKCVVMLSSLMEAYVSRRRLKVS